MGLSAADAVPQVPAGTCSSDRALSRLPSAFGCSARSECPPVDSGLLRALWGRYTLHTFSAGTAGKRAAAHAE